MRTSQLTDLDAALARIQAQPFPLPAVETCALAEALGRMLAEPARAAADIPGADRQQRHGWLRPAGWRMAATVAGDPAHRRGRGGRDAVAGPSVQPPSIRLRHPGSPLPRFGAGGCKRV